MLNVLLASDDARRRLKEAVEALGPLVQGLFEPVAGEEEAIATGATSQRFGDRWPDFVVAVEDRVGAVAWREATMQRDRTLRSADWQPLMTRMREVIDLDLTAQW